MAATYEYWTAVFGVGLDGFSDFDHEELNAIAAEGWEPVQMTAVHNGFAVCVLFRRDLAPTRGRIPPQPAAPKAVKAVKAVKKVAAKKTAKSASAAQKAVKKTTKAR